MEKGMEKEKNIMVFVKSDMKENIYMEKKAELEKNIMIMAI